jgi:hypothetical protein
MARSITERRAKINQLTERIDIKIERERIFEFPNVDRSLEINELKPEHNLGYVRRTEASSSKFNESLIFGTADEVATKKSGLDTCGSCSTRNVENRVPLLREPVDNIPSHWRLPEVCVRKSLLKGMSVTRVTSRVDIDLLIELGRLNEF